MRNFIRKLLSVCYILPPTISMTHVGYGVTTWNWWIVLVFTVLFVVLRDEVRDA